MFYFNKIVNDRGLKSSIVPVRDIISGNEEAINQISTLTFRYRPSSDEDMKLIKIKLMRTASDEQRAFLLGCSYILGSSFKYLLEAPEEISLEKSLVQTDIALTKIGYFINENIEFDIVPEMLIKDAKAVMRTRYNRMFNPEISLIKLEYTDSKNFFAPFFTNEQLNLIDENLNYFKLGINSILTDVTD